MPRRTKVTKKRIKRRIKKKIKILAKIAILKKNQLRQVKKYLTIPIVNLTRWRVKRKKPQLRLKKKPWTKKASPMPTLLNLMSHRVSVYLLHL